MNRDELLKILQEETDGFIEQSRLRDDVLDALEKVQELAINYSQCCKSDSELLKALEDLKQWCFETCQPFEEERLHEILKRL